MPESPGLSNVAALVGQATRADMLLLLLDSRSRTATELADATGVSRPTASFHLAQLVEGGLLRIDRQGRHRYFRLASPEVAGMLESLLALSGSPPEEKQRFGPRPTGMRRARMCYDHMAGELGIAVVDRLVLDGALIEAGDTFQLTETGEQRLLDLGVDVHAARRRRRHFASTCVDWSERRPHLAGALGAAIAARFTELNWIVRESDGRTLTITPAGRRGLAAELGLEVQPA